MTFLDVPAEVVSQMVLLMGATLPAFLLVALFVLWSAWRNRA